jgi:hypothetical protein
MGIHSLAGTGGTESYLTTVADHLQRTGHDVTIYSLEDGRTGDLARSLGVRVSIGARELPDEIDVFLAQDAPSALELLDARPEVPQVYNWHSELFDVQVPPQLDGVVKLIVTLHANADRRVRSLAVKPPVVLLNQPVDTVRFKPMAPLSERPRRLLALGNYLRDEPKHKLVAACEQAGIEFRQLGQHGEGVTDRPEEAINAADIVVGKARVAIEGMACGRAVYVYDVFGTDGWVTAESYEQLAASCFAGSTKRIQMSVDELASDLLAYDPAMGPANRDLAMSNHSAMRHAGQLVEAIRGVLDRSAIEPSNDNAFELARLARVSWRHEQHAFDLGYRFNALAAEKHRVDDELQATRAALASATETAKRLTNSLRWRVLTRLLRPLDRLKRK